jgi:hypothetical protein
MDRNNRSAIVPITAYLKAAQEAFAKYLQLQPERLTKSKKKVLLLLFSSLFGGCSIAVMCYSFITVNMPAPSREITLPKYTITHTLKTKHQDSLITHDEYACINQFKHYLEQLKENTSGKKMYDSLLQVRPYLLDSIHQVDSIYLNQ